MRPLPTGTVTFLFTDVEGSTRLLHELGAERYADALAGHHRVLREAIERNGGVELGTAGDAFFVAFDRASRALAAAREGQEALASTVIRVRMGIHTGEPLLAGSDYVGMDVHKAARIASAAHGGQVLVSEQTARLAGIDEMRDLGEHRLKDLTRPERLFQLAAPGLPADFPPLRTLDPRSNNLPFQTTPLIGRERELDDLAERLRGSARLLTLTGPAGTGKTRLGLQVAAEVVEAFADGVYFVDLAPVTDRALVASTLAQTLGVREEAGRSVIDVLHDFLRPRQMLLLLDNFEQVVDAATVLADLLGTAPRLKLLATSRVPLRIRGEQEYPIDSLPLPTAGEILSAERAARYAGVRLFVERAQAVRPDFVLDDENAGAVVEICRRLDGLPLAIELASARARILTPQAMLSRLRSRLKLLTGGGRDLPARQQTLRGAIAWSWDLLTDDEKVLFRRLAVFSGGRTLPAIESVCFPEDDPRIDPLDGVASLVEKSLLRQAEGPDGEPRFILLETIHEFSREKLEESGEGEEIGKRHAEFFLHFAEDAGARLRGKDQARWLDALDSEHDNLRAAMRGMLDRADLHGAARLTVALQTFWMARAHLAEGRRWAEEVVARLEHDFAPRAQILAGIGTLARQQGDLDAAQASLDASLSAFRALGDRRGSAMALTNLGAVAGERREFDRAASLLEEALALLRELDDHRLMARVLTNLGVIAEVRRDPDLASARYEESLSLFREAGDQAGAGLALSNLGHVAFDRGDLIRAESLFRESLALARDGGHRYNCVHELANLALVAAASASPLRAATLYGASDAHFEALGARTMDVDDEKHQAARAAARALVSPADWEGALAEGAVMSLAEALDYALRSERR